MTCEARVKDAPAARTDDPLETEARTLDVFTIVVFALLTIGLALFAWLIATVGRTQI